MQLAPTISAQRLLPIRVPLFAPLSTLSMARAKSAKKHSTLNQKPSTTP